MLSNPVSEWKVFANGVLQMHAALRRIGGLPPRDFAGIVIDDDEVDRILSELPGLDGPIPDELQDAVEQFAPKVRQLREALHDLRHGNAKVARSGTGD